MKFTLFTALAAVVPLCAAGQPSPSYQLLPSLREQAALQDKWYAERKEAIPGLLKKHGVDAWLVRPLRVPSSPTASASHSLAFTHT